MNAQFRSIFNAMALKLQTKVLEILAVDPTALESGDFKLVADDRCVRIQSMDGKVDMAAIRPFGDEAGQLMIELEELATEAFNQYNDQINPATTSKLIGLEIAQWSQGATDDFSYGTGMSIDYVWQTPFEKSEIVKAELAMTAELTRVLASSDSYLKHGHYSLYAGTDGLAYCENYAGPDKLNAYMSLQSGPVGGVVLGWDDNEHLLSELADILDGYNSQLNVPEDASPEDASIGQLYGFDIELIDRAGAERGSVLVKVTAQIVKAKEATEDRATA